MCVEDVMIIYDIRRIYSDYIHGLRHIYLCID
jgi:hypothetical protein